jgi:hypothetical protein
LRILLSLGQWVEIKRSHYCSGGIGTSFSIVIVLICSPLAAEIKIGKDRVGARTDGGLQIFLPIQDKDDLVAWDRSYYEVALEVNIFEISNANIRRNAFIKRNEIKKVTKVQKN